MNSVLLDGPFGKIYPKWYSMEIGIVYQKYMECNWIFIFGALTSFGGEVRHDILYKNTLTFSMTKKTKKRDPYATPARLKPGAGPHKDKKKEKDKKKCRKKVKEE